MTRSLLDLADNPVRRARKKIGKSVEQASKEAGIHWQTWYLTECGCYSAIPPAITGYFRRKDLPVLNEDYQSFRLASQKEFGFQNLLNKGLPPFHSGIAPIQAFREHCGIDSRASFAKGLCIQVALMFKLEHGNVRFLPRQVYDALINAGLPVEDVEELNERTQEHYESHH